MDNIIGFLIGLLILYVVARLLVVPIKIIFKLILNAISGGIVLILFNLFGGLIGLNIEISFLSSVVVGLLGVPGIVVLLVLQNI